MEQEIIENKKKLEDWLCNSSELEEKPYEIKYVTQFEDDKGIHCMIFKYQKTFLGKWYIGIVSELGTFSEMKEFDMMSATEDAQELLEILKNAQKEMANQIES